MSKPGPSADALARAHTSLAIGVLVEVCRDECAKPADKIKAAEALLDRGHGKATQAVITVPTRQAVAARLASLDDSALLAIAAAGRQHLGEQPKLPFGVQPSEIEDGEIEQPQEPQPWD